MLKANLVKKDRNEVTKAMHIFKARKADQIVKTMLEDKVLNIRERNEDQAYKVA